MSKLSQQDWPMAHKNQTEVIRSIKSDHEGLREQCNELARMVSLLLEKPIAGEGK